MIYSQDSSGSCSGFSCTSCLSSGQVSYSDNSGCVSCDATTTTGIASDGDCACPSSNQVLAETDITGAKLSEKVCQTCPTGRLPVLSTQVIAGRTYIGSKYVCASCPDEQMSMSLVSGILSCSCGTGYTITGVSGTFFLLPLCCQVRHCRRGILGESD